MTKVRVAPAAGLILVLSVTLAVIHASRGPAAQSIAQPDQPAARKHHAMAYDSRHERVVMYGGATGASELLDDLWSWDGTRWTLIGRSIPSASHAVFADADQSLVLIGGTQPVTAVWDGRWVTILQEPNRWAVAGAFDARRGRFVMHGGGGAAPGQTLGSTLEFDGEHWRQVATGGPGERAMASMAFDTTRNIAMLFGGAVLATRRVFDDLWEWDGVRWRQIVVTGERPEARMAFGMAYDQARREVVLFGGFSTDDHVLGDTWVWNGAQWRRVAGDGPQPRSDGYMAYDAARGVTVLFGGYPDEADGRVLGDTWEWDGSRWTRRDMASQ
jgi:hypothetical protein